tara:strand:- start:379 stop:2595 length:2217 start_codon:yes stop_codon:yes gene_type:complete
MSNEQKGIGMSTTTIHHVVVMPSNLKDSNFSFFQGFSKEIAMDYSKILSCLAWVPHDIWESRLSFKSLIAAKMIGSSLDIVHVNEDLLDDDHVDFSSCFTFLWSTESTLDKAIKACEKFAFKPVHISCKKHHDTIYIDDLNETIIDSEIDKLRASVIESYPDREFTEYLSAQRVEVKEKTPFPFPPLNHNCTVPSVKALVSCGYEISQVEDIVPSLDIAQHSKGIIELSSLIDEIRSEYDFPENAIKNDGIVFCASMYSHLYKSNSKIWNDLNRTITKTNRSFINKALIRNKGFANFSLEVDDGSEFSPYVDEVVGALFSDRQLELNLFKDIVSVVAVNQFCSATRLPNGVMLHHDRLKNIASLIKSSSFMETKNVRSLNKKMRSYTEAVRKDIGEKLFQSAFVNRKKLFAICDFPIEWISHNGFPLMFTHEISRIFPTPGNMLGEASLRSERVLIPYSVITNILVIRSFDSDDPIKNHLSRAISIFSESGRYKNINVEIVDVSGEQELIDALNEFRGFITIFDCHGGHGGEEDIAWLYIGGEKLNVWSLANKCHIPPIVILSACSTHPVDGSHASVANGFFRCGVVSVLGTYAPINAVHAGQFVARLLHRISAFVPMIIEQGPVSWRQVLSGLLRMSYVTDVLMRMRDSLKLISEKQYTDIHLKANLLINSRKVNWQDKFICVIEELTEFNEEQVKEIVVDHFQFVETMLYSQLGRPENIVIYKDDNLEKYLEDNER